MDHPPESRRSPICRPGTVIGHSREALMPPLSRQSAGCRPSRPRPIERPRFSIATRWSGRSCLTKRRGGASPEQPSVPGAASVTMSELLLFAGTGSTVGLPAAASDAPARRRLHWSGAFGARACRLPKARSEGAMMSVAARGCQVATRALRSRPSTTSWCSGTAEDEIGKPPGRREALQQVGAHRPRVRL